MTWVLAAGLVLLAVVDARTGRVPNRLVVPLLLVSVPLVVVEPSAGLAALAAATPYLAGFAAHACGGGDVKLALVCGVLIGAVDRVLLALLAASLLTAVHCFLVRRRAVPHGPALVAASLFVAALA